MAHTLTFSPAWCENHLAYCWHSYDNATGRNKPLCNPDSIQPSNKMSDLAKHTTELEKKGYYISHRYPAYVATLYKDHLLPLEWQILAESKPEPEYIDIEQDW
jgi:hypothetical protein